MAKCGGNGDGSKDNDAVAVEYLSISSMEFVTMAMTRTAVDDKVYER